MISLIQAWVAKLLSSLVLLGSLAVALYVIAGGLPRQSDTAAEVSTGDMLHHLLTGSGDLPKGEMEFEGCWTELPAPSREELDENLRKTLSKKNFRRYDQPASMTDELSVED